MKINCDLGESFGSWQMGQDAQLMPYIDMANIACGFHASDPQTMQQTIALAEQHNLSIGAHPSYPDLVGFGRRSMKIAPVELQALLQYQISALQGMAALQGLDVTYVKPHGALYNDMMKNLELFRTICQSVAAFSQNLELVIQALPDNDRFIEIANTFELTLKFEAFADRNYQDNGLLIPRSQPNAVINDLSLIKHRCQELQNTGTIYSVNNKPLKMQIDTLCVHGDHANAIEVARTVRQNLHA
ncbi:UPF0271 protein [Thalassotalea loyana]|uniref:UPF0271 protein n=1 Tax=Thalassotalea loyana TaxID=280483 RepID=A0ABQ6HJW5_9GAMM|nr:5-oxoprolinase subunit PxpA [Thalassotalea loyana]GLX87156.1 UPF0271 protein [Thalassotalea loyana]